MYSYQSEGLIKKVQRISKGSLVYACPFTRLRLFLEVLITSVLPLGSAALLVIAHMSGSFLFPLPSGCGLR